MPGRAHLLLGAIAITLCGSAGRTEADRWWAHVAYLADDRLEGRNTGSEGHRIAAEYVAQHFERAGLEPAGTSGYIQPVKFRSRRILEEQSTLALRRDGTTDPVILGDEATFNMRIEPAERVSAAIVFAGYGLTVPELKHDDLAGLDVRDKVVLYVTGGPSSIPGPLLAHYQSAGERWTFLKRAGAVGTIAIQNPRGMDIPWERSTLARLQPTMALEDPPLDETAGQKLAVTVNPARAEKFFAGSGHSFPELLALAEAGKPLPTFALPSSIEATVRFETAAVESQNVAGILPGSDPELKNEYVVLSAHLDHLGVGKPIGGDSIYNGAMDNASGIATLLDVAAALQQSRRPPSAGASSSSGGQGPARRSLIFLAVTGEEKGLLGSKYFAANPTVKPAALVADVNMDMFLPLFPLKSVIAQGLEESDLGDVLREVAAPLGVEVLSDPEPERNAFTRSDQYSFIRRGVPALSLKVGFVKGSAEHALVKKWRTERYHAPSDDLLQPIDRGAAARFNEVLRLVTVAIANRPERPKWKPESFFRRFATSD